MTQKKIAYKGDKTRETGAKIIKALEDMGGVNTSNLLGDGVSYYYINAMGKIDLSNTLPEKYELAELPTDESVIITPEQGQKVIDYLGKNNYLSAIYKELVDLWSTDIVMKKPISINPKYLDKILSFISDSYLNNIFPKPFPPKGTFCIVWDNHETWEYGVIGKSDGKGAFIITIYGNPIDYDNYHVLPNEVLPKN